MVIRKFIAEMAKERADAWQHSEPLVINGITFNRPDEIGIPVTGIEELAKTLEKELERGEPKAYKYLEGYTETVLSFTYCGVRFYERHVERHSDDSV